MKIIKLSIFVASLLVSFAARADHPIIHLSVGGEISPGVYGQVQFDNAPPPPVFYSHPKIIMHVQDEDELEPIYLHVPPGHAKHWAKHCREYNACGRPVYFVRSAEYEPNYHEHSDRHHRDESYHDERRSGDEGRQDQGRRDEGDGDEGDRGHGRGKGKGHRD